MEEGGSSGVWGRVGDGLLIWVGVCMVVVYGEAFEWVGKYLAKYLIEDWGGKYIKILARLLVWGSTSSTNFTGFV